MMTVDGYFAGVNREINWHQVDDEFNDFAIGQLNSAGTLIFGRLTYELMAGYWPTAEALKNDPIVAEKMNIIPKVVLSRTLDKAEWSNTRLLKDNIRQKVIQLKKKMVKDIFIFGSANLASTLQKLNLIDEYRIMVNPVVLGRGISLFKAMTIRLNLYLLQVKIFKSGNVLLFYRPAN
jgi:dihydrofolate reductase